MKLNIIHLPERSDRMAILEQELAGQGIIDYQIWPGIRHSKTATDISRAHKQIVRNAADLGLQSVTIAEDDIKFTAINGYRYCLEHIPVDYDLYLGGVMYCRPDPDNVIKFK